jgi:hypothetical protein
MSRVLKRLLDDLAYLNAWQDAQLCDILLKVSYMCNRKVRQAVICSWLSLSLSLPIHPEL